NRLTGVVIGMLITATCLLSIRYRKSKPSVFYNSVAAFILVLFQGWLGGRVVETGLSEWLITIHMVLAMIIMTILLYATYKATEEHWKPIQLEQKTRYWLFGLGVVLFMLTMVQLVLGTEVREAVDRIKDIIPRELWLSQFTIDEVHRTFSWVVVISGAALLWLTRRKTDSKVLSRFAVVINVVDR